MLRIVAPTSSSARTAFSGAVMALIRLAFSASSMSGESERDGAKCADIHSYSQLSAEFRPGAGTGVIIYAFGR